jgi:putative ABC transport system permease protein
VSSRDNWRTVVGVARSTRYRELAQPRATLYLPARQFLVTAQTIVVRATTPVAAVAAAARDRVRAIDADVQVMRVVPFGEFLDKPLARPRFNAFVTSVFGVAALLLAAIGLYAVMAVHVRQRFAEIGLRIALGANASDVRRLVLGEGLWLASLGAIAGLAASIAGTRMLRGFLFDVHPLDPATLVASALLLIGASALASYFPARRASRVDPVAMLRAD